MADEQKFKKLNTISGFPPKIKALEEGGATVQYGTATAEEKATAKLLGDALSAPSSINPDIPLWKASSEEKLAKYEEIYGEGKGEIVATIVEAQIVKADDGKTIYNPAEQGTLAPLLAPELSTYFAVLRATAEKQIIDASNTRIDNKTGLTDEQIAAAKKTSNSRRRENSKRR